MRISEQALRSYRVPYMMHFILPLIVFVFFNLPSVSSNETDSIDHFNLLADAIIPLANNKWRLRSDDGVFEDLVAKVPGDLLSDLMTNGMISCSLKVVIEDINLFHAPTFFLC